MLHEVEQIDSDRLIYLLSHALDLNPDALKRVGEMPPRYLSDVRVEIAAALRLWNEDHEVPVCLACGGPRVQWAGDAGLYRCSDCGEECDRIGKRKAA